MMQLKKLRESLEQHESLEGGINPIAYKKNGKIYHQVDWKVEVSEEDMKHITTIINFG